MIKIVKIVALLSVFFMPIVPFAAKEAKVTLANEKGVKVFSYSKDSQIFIIVKDSLSNKDKTKKEPVSIKITSDTEPGGEALLLMETDINTGIFTGKLAVKESNTAVAGDYVLQVSGGDKITASYTLPKDDKGIEHVIDDQAYYMGPSWSFENTGENHTILIPDNATITIDGKPIEKGDFISCFYNTTENGKKVLKNGGGTGRDISPGGIKWTGKTTATAAWGAQQGKKNGFAPKEEFKWKIWRASDGKEYDAVATYMIDDRIPDKGQYVKDGISGVQTLTATSK
ncbi:MAG: hypothetical protein NTW49_12015 [Bacteroidia bacterium]|nr:hypothetical protein [Bacteroidia bacterium]